MLGSLILYLKGMRTTMFQLSGFHGKWRTPEPQKRSEVCGARADWLQLSLETLRIPF